ncbi:MAG TPA: MFS transporter [Candidatus Limnocylindria bacterium]|jgi:MFS family permease|nr:MFS transporter [Candidatus Limnocylindria bacterium]
MEGNWAPARVRRNFRIDTFSAICGGVYIAVLVTFMPIVVRRLGGSTTDVAIVVAAPFVGHLLSPISAYLLSGLPLVRVVAGAVTLARATFLAGVLVAATPLMLAVTTVVFFVMSVANIGAYTALMHGIYPDRERAQAMANVRIGAAIAGIASVAVAGTFIDVIPASWVFAAAALVGLPGAIAFFWVRHDGSATAATRRSLPDVARGVWADHKYRRLLLSFTVFGIGNLMNVAVYPILLVDHFNASNSFIGAMTAVSSGTMVVAYIIWGRMIDRGSSIRLTLVNTVVTLLVPIGYIAAADVWLLIPVAIVAGIVNAGGEITFFTNIVQIAPRDRIGEYATAQSLLMGLRGTAAPFIAAALLGVTDPRVVLLIGVVFMTAGCAIMAGAVRVIVPTAMPAQRVAVESPAD